MRRLAMLTWEDVFGLVLLLLIVLSPLELYLLDPGSFTPSVLGYGYPTIIFCGVLLQIAYIIAFCGALFGTLRQREANMTKSQTA